MQAPPGKWLLHIGIHRGTLTSRDSETPQEYDSRPAAEAAFKQAREDYAGMGYSI